METFINVRCHYYGRRRRSFRNGEKRKTGGRTKFFKAAVAPLFLLGLPFSTARQFINLQLLQNNKKKKREKKKMKGNEEREEQNNGVDYFDVTNY